MSRENLSLAAKNALKGKLSNPRFFAASINLPSTVELLYKAIQAGTYKPHTDKEFDLWCISGQKMRHISVPSIDDLIVQHAIYQVICPLIDKHLIFDTYGCRLGKGTHRAALRCQEFIRQSPKGSYFLQLDVKKYYYSLQHSKLKQALMHLLGDRRAVDFIALQFTAPNGVGMPVGAMIAQIMGLIYLNEFDHYVKRVLKVKHYIRYVDDMVLIGLTKAQCHELREHLQEYAAKKFELGFSKYRIAPLERGINFVGFRTWREKRLIRKRSYKQFARNVKLRKALSVKAGLAHALKTSSYTQLVKYVQANDPELAQEIGVS